MKQGDILDETALITNSTKYMFWDYKRVLKPFSLSSETSCVCHMRPSCPGANPFIIHNSNAWNCRWQNCIQKMKNWLVLLSFFFFLLLIVKNTCKLQTLQFNDWSKLQHKQHDINGKRWQFVSIDSKLLQGHRYGQEDYTQVSNVAISPVHPLGRVCNGI